MPVGLAQGLALWPGRRPRGGPYKSVEALAGKE